jgi:hypothetical protein
MTISRGDNVRRKLGDRRIRPRFDVVGELWGTLEAVLPLAVRNVGRGGALIESRAPLPADSVHRLLFRSDGEDMWTDVRVRYVAPQASTSDDPTFLIGLEFMSVHPVLVEQIDRWLLESLGDTARAEA